MTSIRSLLLRLICRRLIPRRQVFTRSHTRRRMRTATASQSLRILSSSRCPRLLWKEAKYMQEALTFFITRCSEASLSRVSHRSRSHSGSSTGHTVISAIQELPISPTGLSLLSTDSILTQATAIHTMQCAERCSMWQVSRT